MKREQIISLYKEGKTLEEITKLVPCSMAYVKAVLCRARKFGALPPIETLADSLPEIYQYIRQGLSQYAVAERLHCQRNTVFVILRKAKQRGEVPADVLELMKEKRRKKQPARAGISRESIAAKLAALRELERDDAVARLRILRPARPKVIITEELKGDILRMYNRDRYNLQAICDETRAELAEVAEVVREDRIERLLAA